MILKEKSIGQKLYEKDSIFEEVLDVTSDQLGGSVNIYDMVKETLTTSFEDYGVSETKEGIANGMDDYISSDLEGRAMILSLAENGGASIIKGVIKGVLNDPDNKGCCTEYLSGRLMDEIRGGFSNGILDEFHTAYSVKLDQYQELMKD